MLRIWFKGRKILVSDIAFASLIGTAPSQASVDALFDMMNSGGHLTPEQLVESIALCRSELSERDLEKFDKRMEFTNGDYYASLNWLFSSRGGA